MTLSPAQRYLSRLYEGCIDRQMNVQAIRLHLAANGIPKTPAQLQHDLESVHCFTGYAASHPAPPAQSLKAIDKAINREA